MERGNGRVNILALFEPASQSDTLGHLSVDGLVLTDVELILDDRTLEACFRDLCPHLQRFELGGHVNIVRTEINPDLLTHGERWADRKTERTPNRQTFFRHFGVDEIGLSHELRDEMGRRLVEYLDGPFTLLENRWHFRPLGTDASEVQFYIAYAFRSRLFERLVGCLFAKAVERYTAAFEARADKIYGNAPAFASQQ